jgi:hypothetical protein
MILRNKGSDLAASIYTAHREGFQTWPKACRSLSGTTAHELLDVLDSEWQGIAERRTEDCAGDVIMGLVREPSYFRAFPQALSRVHEHNFAAS